MIGLPPAQGGEGEEEREIADFILDTGRRTGMNFNVTVGVFVPKPHTPYQWAAQLDEKRAREKLWFIRGALKSRGHRVGIQDPLSSSIEGLLARGNEGVGELVEEAYRRGCRLDAWAEYFREDLWRSLLAEREELLRESLGERERGTPLPWDFIDSGVATGFLKGECSRSEIGEFTSPCIEKCPHPCGICSKRAGILKNSIHDEVVYRDFPEPGGRRSSEKNFRGTAGSHRVLFSFPKEGAAIFQSHLSLMEIFSMALIRAGLPVRYSEGFNPLARLEIAAPLAVGIPSTAEIALVETETFLSAGEFEEALEGKLPEGILLTGACSLTVPFGEKKHSLSAALWGFRYRYAGQIVQIRAVEDREFRRSLGGMAGMGAEAPGVWSHSLERIAVLARFPGGPDKGESYFEVFKRLYPEPV
jgi:hypothetical protein